jgi:hypothetical protein
MIMLSIGQIGWKQKVWEQNPCKISADCHPRQGILYQQEH